MKCYFCGRTDDQVRCFYQGQVVTVCNYCKPNLLDLIDISMIQNNIDGYNFFRDFETQMDDLLENRVNEIARMGHKSTCEQFEFDMKGRINDLINRFEARFEAAVSRRVNEIARNLELKLDVMLKKEVAKIANAKYYDLKNYVVTKRDHLPAELAFQTDMYCIDVDFLNGKLACGIYFLYRKSVLQYIGKSEKLLSRLGNHLENKQFDKVYFMRVPYNELGDTELEMIRLFKPPLNMRGVGSNSDTVTSLPSKDVVISP